VFTANTTNKGETPMSSLSDLQCNIKIKINFTNRKLSSDADFLLLREFVDKLSRQQFSKSSFKTTDRANRKHLDNEILMQRI
jgi:hypothetical protein